MGEKKLFVDRTALNVALAKKGMTHTDLAKMLNLSDSTISLKFSEERRFNEEEICILYKAFGPSIFLKRSVVK